ncbi:MAG: glycogen/starch synthase [Pseudomonadota bacterium]
MRISSAPPKILVVTPEVSFLPDRSGAPSEKISARSGGLGDVSATLIQTLFGMGADVHVAIPNYRNIFKKNAGHPAAELFSRRAGNNMPVERIHLVQDRSFYYLPKLFSDTSRENIRIALTFQREVINQVIPRVQPDLIHCHDWMTGLIPAMARTHGIPCLFTLYNLNTVKLCLSDIEEQGIDAGAFWQHCYYDRMPRDYEETRQTNPADLLASGVFASHFVNTVSPSFLKQIVSDGTEFIAPALKGELQHKLRGGCLTAIEHAPAALFNPATDKALYRRYGAEENLSAKAFNKLRLQELLGLQMDSRAPLLFWPTRLGGGRRGSWLMSEILPDLLSTHASRGLQVVFIADGDLHHHFRLLAEKANAVDRVAVREFHPQHYRLAFAAADFVLMPMDYEPCGLPCKIAQRYGALPIGHDTGGIHDALTHLELPAERGNGFVFKNFDATGLRWAIDEAMIFYSLPDPVRANQIRRIMTESLVAYDDQATGRNYIDLYERMLQRPFDYLKPEAFGVADLDFLSAA